MRNRVVLTISPLALFAAQALAAMSGGVSESWLKPEITLPQSARAPLTVEFVPDEAPCRKAYGKKWQEKCSASFGLFGARVSGASLSPAVRGTWRFSGGSGIEFVPDDPWPAGQRFKLSLGSVPLPRGVKLSSPALDFATPPLSVSSVEARFWADPALDGRRALSFEAFFSTAVTDVKALESRFAVRFDAASGLSLGRPSFVWNFDRTSVYVRVPVVKLGTRSAAVTAEFPGVAGGWSAADGRMPAVKKGFETARALLTVPAASELFAVKNASFEAVRTESLDRVWELTLETSLLVKPSDALSALRVTELPERLNADAVSKTDWTKVPVVDAETLSRGRALAVSSAQDSDVPTDRLVFRVAARPGTFIHVALPAGFGPDKSVTLKRDWGGVVAVPEPGAALFFLQPGSVMTLSGDRSLTFAAEGAERVHWRIERIRDPFLALTARGFQTQSEPSPGDAVSDAAEGDIPVSAQNRFYSIRLDEAKLPGGSSGLFQVYLTAQKKDGAHWKTLGRAAKRVLVTDTALIAKRGRDGVSEVFAASLETGKPLEGLDVTLYGANGVPLESVKTDAGGRARFRSTAGLEREKAPSAFVARDAASGSMAWLSASDPAAVDNLFDYDISGRGLAADGLAGMLFTERGLYRPGEKVHAALMVKSADWKALPEGMPVTVRFTDPAGRKVQESTVKLSSEGLAEADWQSSAEALPGRMRAVALAGTTVIASCEFRLEDFRPESMVLTSRPAAPSDGWLLPDQASLEIDLKSRFGAASADRLVRSRVSLETPGEITFKGWKGWTFEDPVPFEGAAPQDITAEGRTDAKGHLSLKLPLAGAAAGTVSAGVALEGYEGGSVAATDSQRLLISPAKAMLGWKSPDSPMPLSWLAPGEKRRLELVLLDPTLKPLAAQSVRAEIAAVQYVTELTSDSRGALRYRDRAVSTPVTSMQLETDASGRAELSLSAADPGEYRAVLKLADGTPLAKIDFRVSGTDLRNGMNGTLQSADIRLSADKKDYKAGDTARLDIVSPFAGMALLTLESDRVLASRWIAVQAGRNLAELALPADFSGKAWLSASLVRGRADAPRFLKAYAHAVTPVTVNAEAHALKLSAEAPERAESAAGLTVKLTADEPSQVFVWAVDEGILDLTRYRTPSPKAALVEDRALQVETRQTLSELMPEGIRLPGASPFGGDAALAAAAPVLANPFRRTGDKAAVWWGGLVNVGPEGVTLPVTLPEGFSGSVRFMTAGASGGRVGSAEAVTVIREPLVLSPLLPAFAAPGDRFAAGALASAEKPWSGRLSVTADPHLSGSIAARDVTLEANGEARISGELQALNIPGPAEVTVKAEGAGGTLVRRASLSVRPAGLRENIVSWGRFGVKSAPDVRLDAPVLASGALREASVSAAPAALARSVFTAFADPVSWGTVSERIAEALPYAAALANPPSIEALGFERESFEKEGRKRIAAALSAISSPHFRRGVANWEGGVPDLFLTAWSLDFVLTARRAQIKPPAGLTERLRGALSHLLDGAAPATLAQARTQAYALAVLTKEGTLSAERIEALRSDMDAAGMDWRHDAAAAYIASAYRMMRMTKWADELLKEKINAAPGESSWETPLAGGAALAAAGMLTGERSLAADLAERLANRAPAALTDAEAAMAAQFLIERGLEAGSLPEGLVLTCAEREGGSAADDRIVKTHAAFTLSSATCKRAKVTAPAGLSGLYWQSSVSGWPSSAPRAAHAEGIDVVKRVLDADGHEASSAKAGDVLTVEIRARRLAGSSSAPVLITDLLPGGFELADAKAEMKGSGVRGTFRAEDRIAAAVTLSGLDRVYTYRIRAASPGTYALPAADARDLAKQSVRGRSASGTITVKALQ
ncbi:MAG: hypothetical protein ACFWTZ_04405 [Burkholderia sp.]|jgi:alpha-2-macroglobulin